MVRPDGHRRDHSPEVHGKGDGERRVVSRRLVVVVDDDESVRESLPDLLRELGFDVETFTSSEDFLRSTAVERADCLLLDVAMPGMSGPELQDALARARHSIPIVFITAQADHGIRDRVLAAGAADCLFKPFTDAALRGALTAALPAT
jgi:FixJ family two-component response regulator